MKDSSYIKDEEEISGIGMRIVAPGEFFSHHRIIDSDFLKHLINIEKSDIAHITPVIQELKCIKEIFSRTKIVGASDSAFHNTISDFVKNYAIPHELASKSGVYRFGFHGLSIASILHNLKEKDNKIDSRIIICHLGSGASVTAIKDGRSIDTSMGYSPLDGLIMSSRVGSIDVGAIIHLSEFESIDKLEEILYTKSGLLALSGISPDMRILLEKERENHKGAHLAIEAFIHGVKKYIGAYSAIMGGVDTIVFSGAIGENAVTIRERIMLGLEYLHANTRIVPSEEGQEIMRILKMNL